jgi:hypothetical protein
MKVNIKAGGGQGEYVVTNAETGEEMTFSRVAVYFNPGNDCPVADITAPNGAGVTVLVESVAWGTASAPKAAVKLTSPIPYRKDAIPGPKGETE